MKPAQILRELKKYPKKLLGQHFLVDQAVVDEMITAGGLTGDEVVVEIGPGLGMLTFALLKKAERVIAIEIDYEFANYLRLKKHRRLLVVRGDALRVDWAAEIDGPFVIVSNIPYSITSPLLRKIFNLKNRPTRVILLVQKEMARRLSANAGSRERGLLTVLVEANANVRIIRTVKPGSFYPPPKTDSAIIEIVLRRESLAPAVFWPAVEAGFRHKRQLLLNSLSRDLKLPKKELAEIWSQASLERQFRPSSLSLEQWLKLSVELKRRQ